jgi:hypothetical protein
LPYSGQPAFRGAIATVARFTGPVGMSSTPLSKQD